MSDILDRILERKRAHLDERQRVLPEAELVARLRDLPPPRGFIQALRRVDSDGRLALIAEIKQASPSKGVIREDFAPAALARAYAQGGAACLSVLTDEPFFRGRDAHIEEVRGVVDLPVLRKDFTIDPYQVVEARAIGADCILLIMAAIEDGQAGELVATARELDLDVLVEVHDEAELDRALRLGCELLGINNRNLKTLAIDLATTVRLARRVPPDRLLVAESGLHAHADLRRMHAAGARAFLVGESLMAKPDVRRATRELLGLDPW